MQQRISNRQSKRFEISMNDLEEYLTKEHEKTLLKSIQNNTPRFIQVFTTIIHEMMPIPNISLEEDKVNFK